jgi:hypothetical protein
MFGDLVHFTVIEAIKSDANASDRLSCVPLHSCLYVHIFRLAPIAVYVHIFRLVPIAVYVHIFRLVPIAIYVHIFRLVPDSTRSTY